MNSKQKLINKNPNNDYKSMIDSWVSNTIQDIEKLWEIPISKAESGIGFNVSISYLCLIMGCSEGVALEYRHLAIPLIEKMMEENILVTLEEGEYVAAIEYRRKLLKWYRKLSLESKKELPILGNKISFKKLSSNLNPISKRALEFKLVKQTLDDIYDDLTKIGILNPNYKSFADRKRERYLNKEINVEFKIKRFTRLSQFKLNHINDFINPSEKEPFIQVEQLFACQSLTVASTSSRRNYLNACNIFVKFLTRTYGNEPFVITNKFDEHIFCKYRKYLEQEIINKSISSHSANSNFCLVRITLNRLIMIDGMSLKFFDSIGFQTSRETELKKPFSKKERVQILEAIEKAISDSRTYLLPYVKSGIGKNPLDKNEKIKRGFSNLENARWLFENKLDCNPVYYNTAKTQPELRFLRIVENSDKKLHEVYREWGVRPILNADIILPYLLKLAQVSGLNLDSLINLEIDDYVDCHPATLRPCLRYWKERSNGQKEYHLDLFKSKLTWLNNGQAKVIKWIFEEMLLLTQKIRQEIKNTNLESKLFIFQSVSCKMNGRIVSFIEKNGAFSNRLHLSLSKFIDKYNLRYENGKPFVLTISRFRPTLVSELVDNGVTFREIQLMLGHASIRTTIKYLDSLDFSSNSRAKLEKKLKEIHQIATAKEFKIAQKLAKVKKEAKVKVFFRTPFAECHNIFSPPDFIKNSTQYVPGSPCSQYNKCLSCDNFIITIQDIPKLFAMERDYRHLIEHSSISNTPYFHVILENLQLINSIIDPKLSEFSLEELDSARRLSEYVDTMSIIDGVIL